MKISHGSGAGAGGVTFGRRWLRVQRVDTEWKAVRRAAVRTTDESVLLSRLQTAL